MELTTEDGTVIRDPSSSELRAALGKLGSDGNGYAILAAAEEHYIQVAGSEAGGYIAEYREGSEESHHASKVTNLSRVQIVELLTAYRNGAQWKTMISWEEGFGSQPSPRKIEGAPKIVLLLLVIVAIAFLVQGVRETIATREFLQRAVEVPGRVVQIVRDVDTSARIIEYKDVQGNTQRMSAHLRKKSASWHHVGEYVTVVYDPTDPAPASTAKLATSVGGDSFVMLFIGTVGLSVGIFCWWIEWQRRS